MCEMIALEAIHTKWFIANNAPWVCVDDLIHSIKDWIDFDFELWIKFKRNYIPRSTILPNRFLPRKKFFVEQFHLRFRNWCWHSEMASFAPLTSAWRTPGFSRTNRRCLRRNVVCMAGSMYTTLDVNGEILFGSPTFAMPLFEK